MKCKPYSEITVEIRTQLKTVKITSNIFAVYCILPQSLPTYLLVCFLCYDAPFLVCVTQVELYIYTYATQQTTRCV